MFTHQSAGCQAKNPFRPTHFQVQRWRLQCMQVRYGPQSSVFDRRSSSFDGVLPVSCLASFFFCHSPFGKMTFIYLRLVSVKIALVFLPVSLRFPSSLHFMICRWWGAFVLGDIEHFLLLLLLRPTAAVLHVVFYTFLIVHAHTHTGTDN